MALITAKDIISAEAPDDLYDSLIIQCTEKEFGLSKKQKPRVASKWEVVGIKNKDNGVDREMVRNGVTYVLAGLSVIIPYGGFSLQPNALRFFRDFWVKATGKKAEEFVLDTENPDLSFMDNLVMSAVVRAVITPKTKPLSEEQAAALEEAGKPVVGEPVVDDDGNPIFTKFLQLDTWNKRFTGQMPAF